MRRRLLVALAAVAAVAATSLTTAPQADALGKFLCDDAGRAQVDPIVSHDSPVSAHRHLFFGNSALLALPNPESATYEQLSGASTSCDNPDDTAAYWVPDLVYTDGALAGQSVDAKRILAYYRSFDHKTTGVAEPIPADLRVVAGTANQPADVPLDTTRINWTCDERSSRTGPYPSIEAADCGAATGTVYLTAHIDFPTCWDGQYSPRGPGDTRDNEHLAYAVGRPATCPAGFDHKLAELRETVKWGNGTAAVWQAGSVALVSDIVAREAGNPVASGQTLHADFWNTWVQTGGVHGGMVGMVASCINTPRPPSWCNS
jgi:hypothetical protein